MCYKSPMTVITDRACFSLTADFRIEYGMEGTNIRQSTIVRRLNALTKKLTSKHFDRQDSVPYVFIEEWEEEIWEMLDNYDSDVTLITADCKVTFVVEDPDNKPEELGVNFVKLIVDAINLLGKKQVYQATIINPKDVCIYNIKKGYIQLDNSIYFPQ